MRQSRSGRGFICLEASVLRAEQQAGSGLLGVQSGEQGRLRGSRGPDLPLSERDDRMWALQRSSKNSSPRPGPKQLGGCFSPQKPSLGED